MAKLQRWRRRSTAGEGESPAAAVDTVEPPEEADPDLDGPAADAADAGDADLVDDHAEPDHVDGLAEAEDVAWDDADDVEEAEELVDDQPSARTADAAGHDAADDDADAYDAAYDAPPATGAAPAATRAVPAVGARGPGSWTVVLLARAAHLKQAVFTALCLGGAAALVGRPARESGVILVTVLVGQTILGWHNDIVDAEKDRAHGARGKPIADGRLATGTAWYAIVVGALALVPLAITTGITAACFYLGSVAIAMVGNVLGRTGFFSWWSWAVSFGLLPAYLSYGGWGGQALGDPPEVAITVLAGVLGIGVHFMRSVWGLVADHEAGWTYLPLKLGLRLGATRLLALSTVFTLGVAVAIGVVGVRVGLSA